MRITADQQVCVGAGQCALRAPAVFDQSTEDGTVVLLHEEPEPAQHDAVREAIGLCPSGAISLLGNG